MKNNRKIDFGIDVISATNLRKDLSLVIDNVVHEKPVVIKRTRDYVWMMENNFLKKLLEPYMLSAYNEYEEDGSVTVYLKEIDLAENADTKEEAIEKLYSSIVEYSEEYYNDYQVFGEAFNRKSHFPYVIKALILNKDNKIGDMIQWQHGKN